LFKKISLLKDATDCNFHCFDILVSTMGILMLKSAVFTITDVTSSNRLSIFFKKTDTVYFLVLP
jgi:hypothetical protein